MLAWIAVVSMLALPAWHQVRSHRVHRKLLRAVTSSPEVPPTRHEIRHARRPMWLRLAADLAWLAYLAAVVVLAAVR